MPKAINGRKVCSKCKIEKDVSEFHKRTNTSDGLRNECRECGNKISKEYENKNIIKNQNKEHQGTKVCRHCKKEKNVYEFSLKKTTKDGLKKECKECCKIEMSEYRKKCFKNNKNKITINFKICSSCKEEKEVSNFYRDSYAPDGLYTQCKVCNNKTQTKWKTNNDFIYREVLKTSNKKRKRKILKYLSDRYKNDINYKFKTNLRNRIRYIIRKKGNNKTNKSSILLGCSIEFLKEHLQKTAIQNGYNKFDINNYSGRKYHIDHIIPINAFSDLGQKQQQLICFNWKNLQILTAKENEVKNDNITIKISEEIQQYIKPELLTEGNTDGLF